MARNPSGTEEADFCSVSETLDWFTKSGIRTTLVRVRPMYQRKLPNDDLTMLRKRIHYFSLPGKAWRPISGAFLFARIVGQLREFQRTERIDVLHAHGLLPCGHAAMLLSQELSIPYIVSVYGLQDLISLEIFGDGPGRSRLEMLVKQQRLAGVVHFLGRQPRSEVAAKMKRCTLFALPSQSERVGCLHLEAMSCAKAVIACRGQGIAEVIDHGTNGFLVGPENERELALAMRMLLHEPERRRNLAAASRDTILDRFTVQQQARNLGRIYREVAG